MLTFGTVTTIVQKFILGEKAVGSATYGEHSFSKPWYLTFLMFIGELSALIIYWITSQPRDPQARSRIRLYFLLSIPALCDLGGSVLLNIGLLGMSPSVWSMLRGAKIVFSAIFYRLLLPRPQYPYMWAGVGIVTLSLIIIGLSAIGVSETSDSGTSETGSVLAVLLTIFSQILAAIQIIIEDYLLHDENESPYLIVGVEGFWGLIGCVAICMPIAHYIGGEEGNGIREDAMDTIKMLGNNKWLIFLSFLFIGCIIGLNVFAMLVTEITDALVRAMLESLRMLFIWVVGLILYYGLETTKFGQEHPALGETWSMWSWLELAGFGLLATGFFVYNGMLRLPGLSYDAPLLRESDVKETLNPRTTDIEEEIITPRSSQVEEELAA
jgi:drug/metabolite transporter (DMT)-like permease